MTDGTADARICGHSVATCLNLAHAWRQKASVLREHAAQSHLGPTASAILLREAEAAERAASHWAAGAERDGR